MIARKLCSVAIATCCALMSNSAFGGKVVSAVSVIDAPPAIGNWSFDRTIDQSGLTVGYTSGVTDFASYVLQAPRHEGENSPQNYAASSSIPPLVVDYDLGATHDVLQLAFWQYPHASSGPTIDFSVYTSNDPGFTNSAFVGSFTALIDGTGLGAPGTAMQVFDLTDTSARYVRMDVLRVDNANGTGWSEVAFEVNVVPEPASICFATLAVFVCVIKRLPKNPAAE